MHFCPHCIHQTIIWLVGLLTFVPIFGKLYFNYIGAWLSQFQCQVNHDVDGDEHDHK